MREALQKEMEEKLKEKDEEMSAELKTKIEALTVSLTTKEMEQLSLREQLTTMKTEVEEEKRRQVKVKEEVEGAMEDELVCSICSELLVQVRTQRKRLFQLSKNNDKVISLTGGGTYEWYAMKGDCIAINFHF